MHAPPLLPRVFISPLIKELDTAERAPQPVPELALMSTVVGGTAPLVAEALRVGEGAVRPDLLHALRGAAAAVLPMDAVQEAPQPEPPAHQAAQQTVVSAAVIVGIAGVMPLSHTSAQTCLLCGVHMRILCGHDAGTQMLHIRAVYKPFSRTLSFLPPEDSDRAKAPCSQHMSSRHAAL